MNNVGKKFNRLKVLSVAPRKNGHNFYECICDCGTVKTVRSSHLISGATKSCGCYQRERRIEVKTRHGGSGSRLYGIWSKMIGRTTCPTDHAYGDYGGRGIAACDQWRDYVNFETWAMNNGYSSELTLDRVDVDGNYEPDNCRWASRSIQSVNKRKLKGCSSQYIGVSWIKSKSIWVAAVRQKGEVLFQHQFIDELQAAKARDAFIIQNNLPHKLNNFK